MTTKTKPVSPIRFFVSPEGNNRWSGKLPSPNKARTNGPFATIARAQLAVRQLKQGSRSPVPPPPPYGWEEGVRPLKQKGGLPFPVRVELRGGLYTLDKPLTFTPEDSGSPLLFNPWLQGITTPRDVTYAAYPGEKPIISGGRCITGWKETTIHGRRAWVAKLPGSRRGFTQLWVNGRRAARTRLPKTGYFQIEKLLDKVSWELDALMKSQDRFRFARGDLQAWRNVSDIEFVSLHFWIESRVPFRSINAGTREARLQWKPKMRLSDDHTRNLARYYVENIFEELKEPGQWYHDRSAPGNGELYYLPLPGERIETTEVIAPRLPHVMILKGEKNRPVTNIAFEGLTFSHSEWVEGKEARTATPQAACHIPGGLVFSNTRDCALRRCNVTHIGSYGVEVCDGSSHVEIVGNRITDLAAGGVKVWHTPPPGAKADNGGAGPDKYFLHGCRQVRITDNEIADGGHRWRQAVGILIGKCGGNQVLHNHIHDFDYSGISVGWTWNYGLNHADGNVIEYNHVHDVGRGVLSDMGGIYILGVSSGTRVRYNLVHDIESRGYGGWGIYLDGGCSEVLVESNIVYRTKSHAFFVSRGRDNIVCNNIFALGREGQASRGSNEQGYSFDFTHNILLGDDSRRVIPVHSDKSKEILDFSSEYGHIFGGDWKSLRATVDFNLYYDGKTKRPTFAGKTWEQWRKMGADPHSLIADPRFVNPLKGDFRFRPGSPIYKIGFRPFELVVGPRKPAK